MPIYRVRAEVPDGQQTYPLAPSLKGRGTTGERGQGSGTFARAPIYQRKLGAWDDLLDSGRRYWHDVPGHAGWRARYVKEVDALETTIRFYQEIYNQPGKLVGVHERCPIRPFQVIEPVDESRATQDEINEGKQLLLFVAR